MFKFVTKLKNKKRINKLNAFINKLEISFTFLQVIDDRSGNERDYREK